MVSLRFARLFVAVSLAASACASVNFQLQERRDSAPKTFSLVGAPSADEVLTMRISLEWNNREGLESKLLEAATPGSSTFRQWLSKEEVESFQAPSAATKQAVEDWLDSNELQATPLTPAGDWLSFEVPVSKANELFNTQFSVYRHIASGKESIRALEYSLPSDIAPLVRAAHPITTFSGPIRGHALTHVDIPRVVERAAKASCNSEFTPTCLQALYDIPSTPITSTNTSLAVTAYDQQNANTADMKTFLEKYRPDLSSSLKFTTELFDGADNSQTGSDAGGEANLDIQYTLGMANGIPTSFIDFGSKNQDGDDDGYLDTINDLLAQTSPPQVVSTSYGFDVESDLSRSLSLALCDTYMALTSRGVTITFASGDGGVASTPGVKCDGDAFPPTFPTCPYVTLVGSTEKNDPEVAASFSAGGFSNYFAQTSWQADAVEKYFTLLGSTNKGLYNVSGRGYPDVSAIGVNVQTIVDGEVSPASGTSCSSPIFSSVLALINDQLLRAGQGTLGFANPFFYANPDAFNDITSGDNPGCGTKGFPAKAGWDPVTGLGSPSYTKLLAAALAA